VLFSKYYKKKLYFCTMIIGYDAKRIVRNGTGLGSYGRTLVNDIAEHQEISLRLYAPDAGRDNLRDQVIQSPNVTFCYPTPSVVPFHKALWRTSGIVSDLQRDGVQLYHGLSGELPRGISKTGIKSVVTIHDLIFLRHPEYYHWIDTKIYAWKFRQAIREADHIIAISECTRRDILEFGHVDERKISLIYQSCAPRFTLSPTESTASNGQRYILSVGSIEERKNILLAVKALQRLPEDLSLVIVGRRTPYTDIVEKYISDNHLSHRIRLMHGVSDEQLPALYAGAEAFVYPSRYEGFGIPIIEAIGCGLPVVACTGSCLEEAGGPDNLYVDPDDDEAMANAICQVLRGAEGREERISRSRAYIRRFEGQDVAGQVVDLYRSLL
jgi:glycosyltransferase involved in cell wall biosynthesis